jgi:CBS domain-containing protein
MSRVAEILAGKEGPVHTIAHEATVYDAIERMVRHNVGSLIVMENETMTGIFTERDYLRRIALEGRTSRNTRVSEVMTRDLIVVGPEESVEDCMAIMSQRRIRHLPVMRDGALAGVVSIGDVVRHLSREREVEIRFLKDYISGRYPG